MPCLLILASARTTLPRPSPSANAESCYRHDNDHHHHGSSMEGCKNYDPFLRALAPTVRRKPCVWQSQAPPHLLTHQISLRRETPKVVLRLVSFNRSCEVLSKLYQDGLLDLKRALNLPVLSTHREIFRSNRPYR